jgi:hypothetical protein
MESTRIQWNPVVKRNFDNVQVLVEFRNMLKFYCNFGNIVEIPQLSKFLWNYDNYFFCWVFYWPVSVGILTIMFFTEHFIVHFPPEIQQYTLEYHLLCFKNATN